MDLFDLSDWLDDIAKDSKKEIENAVEKGAMIISNEAKARCPVDTGALRGSIHTDVAWESNTCVGIIGTNLEYAPYIEYGTGIYNVNGNGRQTPWVYKSPKDDKFYYTHGMMAQPFMFPALYAKKDIAFEYITSEITRRLFGL